MNRQTLLKTLPSLAVGNYIKADFDFLPGLFSKICFTLTRHNSECVNKLENFAILFRFTNVNTAVFQFGRCCIKIICLLYFKLEIALQPDIIIGDGKYIHRRRLRKVA